MESREAVTFVLGVRVPPFQLASQRIVAERLRSRLQPGLHRFESDRCVSKGGSRPRPEQGSRAGPPSWKVTGMDEDTALKAAGVMSPLGFDSLTFR